jgi:hypothetical protein
VRGKVRNASIAMHVSFVLIYLFINGMFEIINIIYITFRASSTKFLLLRLEFGGDLKIIKLITSGFEPKFLVGGKCVEYYTNNCINFSCHEI